MPATGIDPEVERYLSEVVRVLERDLADGLVGVYLHGSLAMGLVISVPVEVMWAKKLSTSSTTR